MAEYCEYMWDLSRSYPSTPALARSIYEEDNRFDKRDKKLAINTVRAILQGRSNIDLTDEYVTRFLLARKYRTEQAAALIIAYQSQIKHRQDIFGNLTARDPALQRALRAGIPGVLPARDRRGRCVLIILASQWDPVAVPALSVQRAIFLVLEILIQDPRNQESGFVAVVDWSGFSLWQAGALGAAALRNLITALRGRFPARFKAIHFLSAPIYVQATLTLVKRFLDEKMRNKIYLHGNNLSTLHEHLPTDILPAELGGTGPAFNPGLWAEPVIHTAMKEAEIAATTAKKGKEQQQNVDAKTHVQELANLQDQSQIDERSNVLTNLDKTSLNDVGNNSTKCHSGKMMRTDHMELDIINERSTNQKESVEYATEVDENERFIHIEQISNEHVEAIHCSDNKRDHEFTRNNDDLAFLDAESNSSEFEIISSRSDSENRRNSSLDNKLEGKAFIVGINSEVPSEETNLIT